MRSVASLNNLLFLISLLYTPEIVLCIALCLPKATSKASDISHRVALSLAAFIAKCNKFFLLRDSWSLD